ncbi:hypothetical protein MGG_14117 [Pyricularia oryzae 70-15]|uniref:GLEYA adhesin domain-containing protein n=1 Tax=Pyricularia oryzae (strain 70-15 / ATCC MYA-4617 / FGSC 8958) TaxID=242507 RepID=G4NFU7_PYRO7|nr:uncharacterized protein MGG_14117 [Pyricularia oryzae 70-15]EHA46904.1 hypothetical protein MGG_14117 [Pyricularia oryzae 70-15]
MEFGSAAGALQICTWHGDDTIRPDVGRYCPQAGIGIFWAYYALTNGAGQGQVPNNTMQGDYQDQFSTDAVKGLEPTTTGTSLRITYGSESGACDDSPAVVDGVAQGNASHATYSVVQHRGYLVAEETGNYTLNVAGSDLVAAWFGQYAVSGWDWSNAAVVAQSASEDDDGRLHPDAYHVRQCAGLLGARCQPHPAGRDGDSGCG